MIVKDLLMQCSAEEIVSELMKLCRVDEEENDSVRQSYMKLLSTIKRAVPVNTKYLLIGILLLTGQEENLLVLLGKKELLDNYNLGYVMENFSQSDMEYLSRTKEKLKSNNFKLTPWNEVMGFEIRPENVLAVGPVKLAAAVIYEMTTYGFTEEEIKNEYQKIAKRSVANVSLSKL